MQKNCSERPISRVTSVVSVLVAIAVVAGDTTETSKERRRGGGGVALSVTANTPATAADAGTPSASSSSSLGSGSAIVRTISFGPRQANASHFRSAARSLQEAALRRFAAMFYGASVWDPWLIVAQIACLQALFYLSLGGYLWLLLSWQVPHLSLHLFFDYSALSVASLAGWCCILAFLANALTW